MLPPGGLYASSSLLPILLIGIMSMPASPVEQSQSSGERPPLIFSPQSGSVICPKPHVPVRVSGEMAPELLFLYRLDGNSDALRVWDNRFEFSLAGLEDGPHSLQLVVFQAPDLQHILFQHTVHFHVSTDACETKHRDTPKDSHKTAAYRRFRFLLRQSQLFLSNLLLLSARQVEVPPGADVDLRTGMLVPGYLQKGNGSLFEAPRTVNTDLSALQGISEGNWEMASIVSALQRTVASANESFVFADFGAAWGKQAVTAAVLGRRLGLRVKTIVVEAEPSHFQMVLDTYTLNGLDVMSADHVLVRAGVGDEDGWSRIQSSPDNVQWWGQAVSSTLGADSELVRVMTVKTLLEREPIVDLMHMDIQESELKVLTTAAKDGSLHKIRALFVGTHGMAMHRPLWELFCRLGWHNVVSFEPFSSYSYFEHRWQLLDGLQVWLNPHLIDLLAEFGAAEPVSCEAVSNTWPPQPAPRRHSADDQERWDA